jgi:hypothetical protein
MKKKEEDKSETDKAQIIGKFKTDNGELHVRCRCGKIYKTAPSGVYRCACGFMVYKLFA